MALPRTRSESPVVSKMPPHIELKPFPSLYNMKLFMRVFIASHRRSIVGLLLGYWAGLWGGDMLSISGRIAKAIHPSLPNLYLWRGALRVSARGTGLTSARMCGRNISLPEPNRSTSTMAPVTRYRSLTLPFTHGTYPGPSWAS